VSGPPAFIRGVGAITALGDTWSASVARLAAGACAIREVSLFDVTGFPSRAAAWIDRPIDEDGDRRHALAAIAAAQAWEMAGVDDVAADRRGVFIGAESGRAPLAALLALSRAAGGGDTFDHRAFAEHARPLAHELDAAVVSPATVASGLAARYGAHGPVATISIACASGAAAIVEAVRALRAGEIDVALAGGVGADVDPLMLAGFGKLSALSESGHSCPFDVRRDGFVVGEGAAMVVLSREQGDARAAVTGVARSLDAHHLTAPPPDGRGAEAAMRGALDDAGHPAIGYVQAHGTSTPLNDAIEAQAIRRVFDGVVNDVAVGSVKGALGHWIAGAGALGVLCAWEAVTSGTLLPTAGLREPDRDCALHHVLGEARHVPVDAALANAFAFGGANSSVVIEATR
jgi:3-oxoacyl-[acyl-carrier-protein] synthase II